MDVVAFRPAVHAGVGSACGALLTYLVSYASLSTNTLHAHVVPAAVDSDDEDVVEASANCPIRFQLSVAVASDHSFFLGGGVGALVVVIYLWLRRFLRLVELVESSCLRLFGKRSLSASAARPTLVRRPSALPRESSAFWDSQHG
jgi:hypothetical protein